MIQWLHITLVAVPAAILAILFILLFKRCVFGVKSNPFVVSDAERGQSMQSGIARLHQVSPHHHHLDHKSNNYYDFRSTKPFFDWDDHPSLISDAVENGWPQFAFTAFMSSPSVKPSRPSFIGSVCAASDQRNEIKVEIGWEVSEGSSDFMQKIRLNPGLKKVANSNAALSLIRTALPLPGPRLENLSFPQEAFFEITILPRSENVNDHSSVIIKEKKEEGEDEGDKILLMSEDFNAINSADSLRHVASSHSERKVINKFQELKFGGKSEAILLCVGLTGGSPTVPLKFPGTFPGSIGFSSTGSLYLDGTKLVPESEGDDWGRPDKVIGCGYDPTQKKVFFTVNSQLVHEVDCKTVEFGFPLYPTLAANGDVIVLVNLGQRPFKFAPANLQRTSNPCFNGPLSNSPSLGYDDSKELFSMGRIDAQWWLQRNGARSSNNNTVNSLKALEYDQDSEGDLFEIILDSTGRSPYVTPYTPRQLYNLNDEGKM